MNGVLQHPAIGEGLKKTVCRESGSDADTERLTLK